MNNGMIHKETDIKPSHPTKHIQREYHPTNSLIQEKPLNL